MKKPSNLVPALLLLMAMLSLSTFLSRAEGGKSRPSVTLDKGAVFVEGGRLMPNSEIEKDGILFRAKDLKGGGRSLLVKGSGQSVDVFGRAVKLGAAGQYQVKWDAKEMVIATASVDASLEPSKWAGGEELYGWFSGNEEKAGAERKPLRRVEFSQQEKDRLPEPRRLPLKGPLGVPSDDYNFAAEEDARNGAEAAVVDLSSLPRSGHEGEYVIQPGDTIDLSFYRVQRVTVDLKGDIRVASSVGSAESVIKAAGKTPKEIAQTVMDSGLNFRSVIDPALKVNVAKFSDRSIVVLGAVRNPGKIPLDDGEIVGVPGVLKKAGGVSGSEKDAVVYVKRGDRITKADLGESDRESLNLFKIMPGDIITVNKK
jgi:protein involved in polysaccharide export with SLBB domain